MQPYQLFINNQWIPAESGETFQSINPFSNEPFASFARGKKADIDKAVKAARAAFDQGPWPKMSGEERSQILHQIAQKMEERAKELTQLVIEESGSTFRKAKGEVWLGTKQMAYFAELAKQDLTETVDSLSKPGVSKNILLREPLGVCAQIIPWNFPFSMAIWKLGPALATGNTIVLKPAEETSAVAMFLTQLIAETDLPAGVLNVVTGYGEEAGAALSSHPLVDKVAFTGSTEIGKKILQDAASNMKKVTLECGGKSANIVLDDADLEMAVDGALYAAFFHTGQCCTAGTRLLLQEGIYDRFLEAFVAKAKRIQLGNPAAKETDMGPLISKKQQERVLSYIEKGKQEGATILAGGSIPSDSALQAGNFIEPTVFGNVTNEMTIAREEIFGPVVAVLKFKTPEEAVAIANDSIYGLAGAVWSQNEEKAIALAKQLRAGTIWVNEYHLISEKAPFGGYKQSGVGRELGLEGLREYTELKHLHIDEIRNREKKFWYDSVLATPQPAGKA